MHLRSIVTLLFAASLVVVLTAMIPGDYGQYGSTFDLKGLPGFVQMPSVNAMQIWFVVAGAVLLPLGLREARRCKLAVAERSLSIATACATLGLAGYLLSVGGIAYVSRAGMFGMGPAGLLAMFVLFPSLLLLAVAIITTIVAYAILAVRG